MAVEASREAPGGRLVLLTGLTALVVVAAAAFGRVYQGHGPTVRLGFVALLAMGLAILLERRSLVLATIVSAIGLAVAVALFVFPDTTAAGLPTLATLHQALTAFASVARTSAVEVAPAPPLPPLLLAGITAAWTAAFATHALAVRARSPLLATAPPAALMVFAGIVMGDGARPLYVLVFLAAGLAVLFADALRRVSAWGPVSVWHERRSVRSGGGATARGAWRVAIGCLAIALFAPWVLPGFGSTALLSVRGGVAAQVSIDPTVDIRPRLLQNPATQLFTAQSAHASYWRFMTLDSFSGRHWTSSHSLTGGTTPQGNLLPAELPSLPCMDPKTSDAAALRLAPQPCPAGFPDSGPTVYWLTQHFNFGPLAQPWLPAAPDPISASLAGQQFRYDPETSAIVYPNGSFKGFSYSAVSVAVVPTPAELSAIPSLQVFQNPNWTHYVQLPDNIPPQIGQIANQIVADAGATTPYAKILAIQDYLKDFTYDTHVKAPTGVNDLLYFLTKAHRGYCEQFAGTMAVMLRELGIPARVAVGFTSGTYNSGTHSYQVTTQNAHSWVEVEFPGLRLARVRADADQGQPHRPGLRHERHHRRHPGLPADRPPRPLPRHVGPERRVDQRQRGHRCRAEAPAPGPGRTAGGTRRRARRRRRSRSSIACGTGGCCSAWRCSSCCCWSPRPSRRSGGGWRCAEAAGTRGSASRRRTRSCASAPPTSGWGAGRSRLRWSTSGAWPSSPRRARTPSSA